jgi:hypothetical protein
VVLVQCIRFLSVASSRVRGEQGAVAIVVALFLAVGLGFIGLVLDLGNARQYRRQAQAGADGAALAGAQELLSSSWTWSSVMSEVKSYAANDFATPLAAWAGCGDAQALAYAPDLANADTCISSDSASAPTAIRVRLPTKVTPTLFARVLGLTTTSVSAAASAAVVTGSACALCLLSPTASPALSGNGNGSVIINGGGLVVNSTAGVAASLSGHAVAAATSIGGPAGPGGFRTSGGASFSPAPLLRAPVPDPLSTLPQCPGAGTPSPCPTTSFPDVSLNGSTATQTLTPGIYHSISSTNGASLALNPGTYIITGSFGLLGNGSLQAAGVTLYFSCSAYPTPCAAGQSGASLSLNGNGAMNLSPPTTGPFQGLTVFFDPANTVASSITGNGGTVMAGTVYMRSAALTITGNGSASTLNSMIAANTVTFSGNGGLNIAYTETQNVVVRTIELSQ